MWQIPRQATRHFTPTDWTVYPGMFHGMATRALWSPPPQDVGLEGLEFRCGRKY
jgi:hypothetical protein